MELCDHCIEKANDVLWEDVRVITDKSHDNIVMIDATWS